MIVGQFGGSIDTAAGTAATWTGAITGAGGLTKTGSGTLILSGANTYSGATTALAGTLRAGRADLFGASSLLGIGGGATVDFGGFDQSIGSLSGSGTLALGFATLTIGGGGASTLFGGAITGAGRLVKNGGGTLALTGSSNYTGGTTINGGALLGTTASIQGNIVNNAAVVFDQGGTGTYSGIMSGSGSLIKAGNGTLVLTGANTYGGGTAINAGTLVGNTTSLQGFIQNDGALTFDQTTDGIFNGVITGSGSVTKSGFGALTISGANLFRGSATINQGTLALNGAFAGDVNIGAAGRVLAAGSIGGSMNVAGSLVIPSQISGQATFNATRVGLDATTAGQVPALVINGNLTTVPGSSLDFTVAPNAVEPIAVLGSATLSGTRLNITIDDPAPTRTSSYLAITAAKGLTTSGLDAASPVAGIVPVLKTGSNAMIVTLLNLNIPLAVTATSPNGTGVGQAVDRIKGNATGDLGVVVRELTALDDRSLALALQSLSGEVHASELRMTVDEGIAMSDLVRDAVSDRDHDADDGPRVVGRPSVRMWFQLAGDHARYTAGGFTTAIANTGGGGGGFDFHPSARFTVGGGASFSRAGLSLTGIGGSSDLQAPRAFGYGGANLGPFSFHGGGSAARTSYSTQRTIAFKAVVPAPDGEQPLSGGIDRQAESDQTGLARDAWTEWQDTLKVKSWVFDWKLGWRAATYDRNPFNETGAASIGLSGLAQVLKTREGDFNVHLFRRRGTWRPNILVNYRRELGDDTTSADVQLADQPAGRFVVNGVPVAQDQFHGLAGLTMRTGSGFEYTFEYETRRAKDENHQGVHFRVRFK